MIDGLVSNGRHDLNPHVSPRPPRAKTGYETDDRIVLPAFTPKSSFSIGKEIYGRSGRRGDGASSVGFVNKAIPRWGTHETPGRELLNVGEAFECFQLLLGKRFQFLG